MEKKNITVKGYVNVVPDSQDTPQIKVAVVQDEVEYLVLPKGAGVDLVDELSMPVEATGTVEEKDGLFFLTVRGYKVLDDTDDWDGE